MKTHATLLSTLMLFFCFTQLGEAQTNIFPNTGAAGIGTTTPDASSLLDVSSTTKGILIPRMTKIQRDAIASPSTGLLIYQTNSTPGFYYFDGSSWGLIAPKSANKTLSNLTSPTAVDVDLLPGTNNILNLGSATLNWKNIYAATGYWIGADKVIAVSATSNTFLGITGNSTNTGSYNTFVGKLSGLSNTTGSDNTASGASALLINTTGYENTATGSGALSSNTTGYDNIANGFIALKSNTTGYSNTAVGVSALFSNTTGFFNTAIGPAALNSNTTGSGNTASGVGSLYSNTTGSNNAAYGLSALYSNTTGGSNTANGISSLYSNTTGSNNTACGVSALYSNTIANGNTSEGFQSLYFNTTGIANTANGTNSLYSNTTGNNNTAQGLQSLYSNTTGSSNTANGLNALFSNTTGNNNAANGTSALYSNTTGTGNSAHGAGALYSNTTGSGNTADGNGALYRNTTGSNNTACGTNTLYVNTTGSYNTVVGYNSGSLSIDTFSNASAFGANTFTSANNQVRVGSSAVTSIGGYAGWTTLPSDRRFKKNIQENVKGLDFILKLRPVTYNLDVTGIDAFMRRGMPGQQLNSEDKQAMQDKEKIIYTGFIAQEVEAAAKEAGYDFSGVDVPKNDRDVYGLRYAEFVVPLVKAIQELNDENGKLKMENSDQQKQINDLKSQMQQFDQSLAECCTAYKSSASTPFSVTQETAKLEQNIPNPYNSTTLIKFYLPQTATSALIKIYSLDGVEMKSFSVNQKGYGEITIASGTLASGVYAYTLIIDGNAIDTKQMILTK